jgi:hypothetical protein
MTHGEEYGQFVGGPEEQKPDLCRRCHDYPCHCYEEDDEDYGGGCYQCGGRGYIVTCIDDLCHGQDECIHGDPPTPCPTCNPKGDKEDGLL